MRRGIVGILVLLVVVGVSVAALRLAAAVIRTKPVAIPLVPLELDSARVDTDVLPFQPGSMREQNVLLVTLDTMRPDRLGFYGHGGIETPNLDAFASDAAVFSDAVATTSTTLPSHASILTGLYPHRHGARANGLYSLADEHRTLAEILAEQGYETGAFVSSFALDDRFGLDQGFDKYDDRFRAPSALLVYKERTATETTSRAIEWIDKTGDRPFFLWVHYYDPHVDYRAPDDIASQAKNPYDAEVAYVDRELGRLFDAVRSSGAGNRETLIVVTADHAESFGEHGEWNHGILVNEGTLRIPLVVGRSDGLDRSYHVPTRVSQVDLMPTILSVLGLPIPESIDGVTANAPRDPNHPTLAEGHYGYANYGWSPIAALYEGPFKYVESPNPELYDLASDPLEHENIVDARPEEALRLRARLRSLRGPTADELPASNVELSEEDIARLRALGYLVGGGPSRAYRTEARDPKEMLPLLQGLLMHVSDLRRYQSAPPWLQFFARMADDELITTDDELILRLEAMAVEDPDFAPIHRYLMDLYRTAGRPDDARRASRRLEALASSRRPTQ